jgi:hypothetical protein
MIYLEISAHVNNDLAFMIEEMGSRYLYPQAPGGDREGDPAARPGEGPRDHPLVPVATGS